ncbi:S66 peptidase family protein [Weizmannia acidilactici]|uniref:S66 peptidase family protein n=1 Tax=Weizmannia acidilactici TaxID=2607726 RepID=UPI00124C0A7A|nr:LD-carboxypeptidase [Weizmannia acidilactici]GER67718.1 peptidase S66 [Weizmannia acidilactici]GER73864.1 peptidase S66 [Weizmannia acidilactici]
MRKGKALTCGATVGLVAPASPVLPEKLQAAVVKLHQLGFQVKLGESCGNEYGGYMAGTPLERAADINNMFADEEVDAILCLRGGYGSPQILPYLDYEMIKKHPKLFTGYSDITAIHTAFLQKCGLATIHGPMAAVEFIRNDDKSVQSFLRMAMAGSTSYSGLKNAEVWGGGKVTAPLVGGNLSLICTLMGTPYELDTKGKILFLEEVHEEPYAVDRMLTQLFLSGKLDDAAGFVLGQWTDCEAKEHTNSFTVQDVLKHFFCGLDKPVLANIWSGHCTPNVALPLGIPVTVDTFHMRLEFNEKIVEE